MEPGAVTVLDQQGVALSRRADAGPEGEAGGARLEAKREIETYLSRKVAAVLDQAFGPGNAIVSVDVLLDTDQVKVTREDVLPVRAVSRRKETVQRPAAPALQAASLEHGEGARAGGTMSSDVEYQHGRKVEQTVSGPGSVRRISVGVLLPAGIEPQQAEGLKEVIAMAVGLNPGRGDALAFSWVGARQAPPAAAQPAAEPKGEAPPRPAAPRTNGAAVPLWIAGAALGLLLLALVPLARRRREAPALSPKQREEMLAQLKGWIAAGAPHQGTPP
jgi:flagellar M-ring protein FliF